MVSTITLANLRQGGGNKPPIGVIYGTPGIGKTTLASKFPSPIFLQTEDGLTSHLLGHVPTLGVMQSYEDVQQALGVIYENAHSQGWKTLVVDTLSKLDPMLMDYVSRSEFGGMRLSDVPFGKGWQPYETEWRTFINAMQSMRNDLGINVVMLDHAKVLRVNPPESESYTKHTVAVNEKAAPLIIRDLDFLLFANYPLTTLSQDVGFNKKITRAISDKARLYCLQRAAHDAKNRYGMPSDILLDFDLVAKYMPTLAGIQNSAATAAE